ncbi:MAG: hypothetical protein IJ626_01995 [Muribaculaceae bacterium]|nr:hypothetical protein [Muribaculaceae bacterium]
MKHFYTTILTVLMAVAGLNANAAWIVSGSGAILNGETWNHTSTVNVMTQQGDGSFKLVVENCILETGVTYQWLITDGQGGAWIKTGGNDVGDNFTINVTETAKYTVTYKFNGSLEAPVASADVVKTGSAGEVSHEYSIAGTPASIFGTEWDPTNTSTNMSKNSSGIYEWTSSSFNAEGGSMEIKFKVVVDHAWGEAYPASDYVFNAPEGGPYTLTITFDPNTKGVGAELNSSSPINHTYSVAGAFGEGDALSADAVFTTKWDPSQPATTMTKNDTGMFEWESPVFTATANDVIEFKVVEDNAWAVAYPAENYQVTIEADGNYTLVVYLDPDTKEVYGNAKTSGVNDLNADKQVAGVKYYNLLGVESAEPFAGLNVMVTTYSDGTRAAKKVVK